MNGTNVFGYLWILCDGSSFLKYVLDLYNVFGYLWILCDGSSFIVALLSDIIDDRKAGRHLGLQRVVAEWMLF